LENRSSTPQAAAAFRQAQVTRARVMLPESEATALLERLVEAVRKDG
jgi:hypothetical protein